MDNTNEDRVNYNNIHRFGDLPPTGYAFTRKLMTQKACGKLRGYWIMNVNANEKKEEMKNSPSTDFDRKWMGQYEQGAQENLQYLRTSGFIKKSLTDKK